LFGSRRAGKVDVADGRIVARDAARTGDAELDLAMESLVQAGRPPKARAWVGRPRRGIVAAYLGRLTGSGALRGEDAFFGTRWHAVGEAAWAADAASPAPGRPGTCGWAGRDLVPAAHAATHAATQAAESATIAAVAAAAPGSAAGSPT
jgi:hypothetical protein